MRTRAMAASGLFLVFLLIGSAWVGMVRLIPSGVPRTIVAVVFGGVFVSVFVGLLVQSIRRLLAGEGGLRREVAEIAVLLALVILAFAFVYSKIGIQDNTGDGGPAVTHDLLTCIYYSVVTFTTLGYGDFYPVGLARAMAALEALTGYVILGVLVSTSVTLLDPREGPFDERDEQPRE